MSILPECHNLFVETPELWHLAVGADGEIIINPRYNSVVVLLLPVFPHIQLGQSRVRNDLLSLAIESIGQSWQFFVFQSQIDNLLKHSDLTVGVVEPTEGAGEMTVLQNQLLVVKEGFKISVKKKERNHTCNSAKWKFSASL